MVGGDFFSRPRPCIGCSVWEWDMILRNTRLSLNFDHRLLCN
jgi:hypothetical protein